MEETVIDVAARSSVEAQLAAKIPRIGYLTSTLDEFNPNRDAFRQGLRGHRQEKNESD